MNGGSTGDFDPERHDSSWLNGEKADRRLEWIYERMQRGLIYPAPHAVFATFWRREDDQGAARITRLALGAMLAELRAHIHQHYSKQNTTAVLGVNINLWLDWCSREGLEPPSGMRFDQPDRRPNGHLTSAVIERSHEVWADSEGDLWFHIKSDKPDHCQHVLEWLQARLITADGCCGRSFARVGDVRMQWPNGSGGKVLGGRFAENINNPTDPITIAHHSLVGYEDWRHLGASFVLSQSFELNWASLHALSDSQIEDVIGRKTDDTIVPTRDGRRSHIKAARARDQYGSAIQILRLGLPFGRSPFSRDPAISLSGGGAGDEEGIYFAGFARSLRNLEAVMNQMLGATPQYTRDALFEYARSTVGGFFYVPNTTDLELPLTSNAGGAIGDWRRFPGVEWNRLNRHFDRRSSSSFMFYNSYDYLYRMATASAEERATLDPPSNRVLTLLSVAFSKWRDNWYFDRKQEEMGDLHEYVSAAFGRDTADQVMTLPVMERKGWANRMTLRLYASDAYGFPGSRIDSETGRVITGADTYRVHPREIIVGGMENLSLSQGRYVMTYLNDEERLSGFIRTLSEASGVGHVVPDHAQALAQGIGGMIASAEEKAAATRDEAKASFYRAVKLSLQGVQEWSVSYADLASRIANDVAPGQAAEKANLLEIEARMRKLATDPPETFVEAVQLLFTMHCCLHLTGEPTAIGRFDQLLLPFYTRDMEAGRLTAADAQQIVDCFFIKLGEKVQQNRLYIEDHQPYGNLAMGNMSGPYPKGGSTNQWIQQLTVGGTVASDDDDSKPAYNDLTMLALRATRRLPLNAPCVSLRVRRDIPSEYLEEAARGLLSGGAHPILINDDKVIPGLAECGDDVGGAESDPKSVAARSGAKWNSRVALRSARNYACDGCYEPQFPGENWFTLGGFSTLDPLECALNMGKTYAAAGPSWYRGRLISIATTSPEQIQSFDQLLELYFQHFHLLYTKSVNTQLGAYGAMADYCPTPLLSSLMPSCMARGKDLYDGGGRYNVIGPCFTGLASTINSLFAIRTMVFEPGTAVTSLPELVECLICDWGHKMVEPFMSALAGPVRTEARASRFQHLRTVALGGAKYGRGNPDIDAFGDEFVGRVAAAAVRVFREPAAPTSEKMVALATRYGTPEEPFGVQIQPGVGTFASFVEGGQPSGASADGRRLGETLPSDLSPSPSPDDQQPDPAAVPFLRVLDGFTGSGTSAMWNFAPTDLNIAEDFPEHELVGVLRAFSDGRGSNMLTVTCASPDTLRDAPAQPEQFDLLRVRMGGWTEFFTAMFPDKQRQHQRRPLHLPG